MNWRKELQWDDVFGSQVLEGLKVTGSNLTFFGFIVPCA